MGEYPEDWSLLALREIVDKQHPITYGIVQAGPHVVDGVPYIRVSDMTRGYLTLDSMLRTNSEIAAKYKRSTVHTNDLVFALRGSPGLVLKVPGELDGANLTQGTARIAPGSAVEADFLLWAIRSDSVQRDVLGRLKGSTFREITLDELGKITIPLPPLAEQRKIAAILSTWDAAITLTAQLIAALQRRKQALVQLLLTGEVRFPEFEDEWEQVRVSQLLTESRLSGTNGAKARKLTVKLYGKGVLPKEENKAGSKNTIYFTRRAGQFIYSKLDFLNGAFGIIPDYLDGYETTLDLPAFDVEAVVNPIYFLNYVQRENFYKSFWGSARGGRKARRIQPSEFLATRITMPKIDEQNRIAEVISTMNEHETVLCQYLEELQQQKRGLMQQLLTGAVRVQARENEE